MPEFLTTRQLQEILHVDRTTIYRMADDGRIPAIKVGNQWRFSQRSIEGWLKTQSSVTVAADSVSAHANGLSLEKLLPVDCVQRIQDTFADMLGVMMVITDLDGHPLTQVSNPCGFFKLAQASSLTWQQCQQEWSAQANQPSLQPILLHSHLGLLYTRGLVRVGSELKAMLVVGGIAPTQWPPDARELARLCEALDVPEATLRRSIDHVFTLDALQQQQVMAFVQRIADIVAHIITERNVLFTKLQSIADLSRL